MDKTNPQPKPVARFDAAASRLLDRVRGPVADRVFYAASELGDFSLIWHWVSAAQTLGRGATVESAFRASTLLGIESALVNGPIKSMFKRTRPVHAVARPRKLRQPKTSSFPSGHASAAFTFAGIAASDDPLKPVYYALAVVVSTSRVYVNIHHASDVVGGAVTGVVLGRVFRNWWPPEQTLPRPFGTHD
jgi:membrane-associated phospholipid phosphatase